MIEARLRIEVFEGKSEKNPFYGDTSVKTIIEKTLAHSHDKRGNIAPFGVNAEIAVDDRRTITIKVNRYYLDNEDGNEYYTAFSIDEKVYELHVTFNNGKIATLFLYEWVMYGFYENGDDPDNIYSMSDFLIFDTFI